VPAISWIASQAPAQGFGGLAVLLDGPQGVSVQPDRLGISLLRAPTWPDPGADNGLQRLRLALMPCRQGWRQQAVPRAAQRFREPLWLRPAQGAQAAVPPPPLELGEPALQLISLRPAEQTGQAWATVHNLSPQRQLLQWPAGWQVLDGPGTDWLAPWQLARFRLCSAAVGPQSS